MSDQSLHIIPISQKVSILRHARFSNQEANKGLTNDQSLTGNKAERFSKLQQDDRRLPQPQAGDSLGDLLYPLLVHGLP
jgi:hypothetical protein